MDTLPPEVRAAKSARAHEFPIDRGKIPRHQALPGIPGGVELDLFSPDVIAATEERLVQESLVEACPNAWESVEAELQQPLPFSEARGGACEYEPPASALLAGRRPGSTRRKEISDVPEDVARLSDAALARRLYWVWQHRGRGASGEGLGEHDAAIQAEWTEARAAGFGLLRELVIAPSHRFIELAGGRRALTRRMVLQLLMVVDAQGWNGFCLSAAQAEDLGYGSPAAWWRSIAWLEQQGLLVRLRRYKAGTGNRPVDLTVNWYGPGPKLLALREVYLAALGTSPEGRKALEEFDAERERSRRRVAGQNRRRRHAHRSTYEGRKVSPAWQESWDESRARWAEILVEEAGARRREEADAERARHILATGDLSSLGEYQDPLPLDHDQALQLEAALGGEPYEGPQLGAYVPPAEEPATACEASHQEVIGISLGDTNPFGVRKLNQEEGEISSLQEIPLSPPHDRRPRSPTPEAVQRPSPPLHCNDVGAVLAHNPDGCSPEARLPPDIPPGQEPRSPENSEQNPSSGREIAHDPSFGGPETSSVRRDAAEEILRMVGEISDPHLAKVLKTAAKQWLQ